MDGIEKSKLKAMDKSMHYCIPRSIAFMDGIEKSKLKAMNKGMPDCIATCRCRQ